MCTTFYPSCLRNHFLCTPKEDLDHETTRSKEIKAATIDFLGDVGPTPLSTFAFEGTGQPEKMPSLAFCPFHVVIPFRHDSLCRLFRIAERQHKFTINCARSNRDNRATTDFNWPRLLAREKE